MKHENIEKYEKELRDILSEEDNIEKLQALAKKVGASIYIWESMGGQKPANESALSHNIHFALQTVTMIDVCRTANRNFWIAIVVAIVAVISAAAAWVAALQ